MEEEVEEVEEEVEEVEVPAPGERFHEAAHHDLTALLRVAGGEHHVLAGILQDGVRLPVRGHLGGGSRRRIRGRGAEKEEEEGEEEGRPPAPPRVRCSGPSHNQH